MILLSGHSLTPDRRVPIEKHSLRLRERESEADITPADMGGIGTESWLLDDVEPGAGIVWRVASIRQEFATATPTVHLEHMINSLRDRIMFGEVDAATMSGRLGATTCTAQEAIEYILSQQSDWVLYSFDFDDVEGPYKFNGDTLYDALSHVSSTLDGAWWSYDFSVYPFRLSITNKASGVGSELIPGRNLSAITKTVDKSGMYTRFYPIGKDDLHITGDYVSKNESTYGVIAKVETDLSLETEDELTAWANERLRKHADPAVTVEVEGLELADATGEGLDRMRLGRICRVSLSEFGVTIQERITELYYADKAHDRESVTITLSNRQDDVARDILHVIAEEIKTGSGRSGAGGRGAAKDQKEDHAWFEDTDEYVAMCAIGIIGVDREGNPDWYRLSQLVVDGEGVHSMVQRVHYDQVEMYSIITQNEEMLRAEFQDNINSLHSEFQITAESLRVEFSNETASLHSELTITAASLRSEFVDESNSVRSLISQEAGRISLVVTGYGANAKVDSASIVAAINQTSGQSEVHIDASHVYINAGQSNEQNVVTEIGGKCKLSDVSADYISGKLATLPTLYGISATYSGTVAAAGLIGNGIYVKSGGSNIDISDPLKEVKIDGPTNNEYKLQYKKFSQSAWQDAGSFSRAVASWTLGWSGGTFTAKANPQNQSASTTITQGTPTWNGNVATVPILGADSDNPGYPYATGRNVVVDATSIYNAASPASATMGGVSGTGQNHECTITKGDGTTTTLVVDCSGIYTAARQGYTQGTFTLTSVTPQGDSQSVYIVPSSGGTAYYQAGTAVTVYDKGSGITVYDAGTAIEVYSKGAGVTAYSGNGGEVYPITGNKKFYHVGTARHYDVNGNLIGNHDWYYAGSGTTYYQVGSKTYARGDEITYYPAIYYGSITPVTNGRTVYPATNGRSITPISGSALNLSATTRYKAGTPVTDTYYTKS